MTPSKSTPELREWIDDLMRDIEDLIGEVRDGVGECHKPLVLSEVRHRLRKIKRLCDDANGVMDGFERAG